VTYIGDSGFATLSEGLLGGSILLFSTSRLAHFLPWPFFVSGT
jgi:hypothetical protein